MLEFTTLIDALTANKNPNRTISYIEGIDSETEISYFDLYNRALSVLHQLQTNGLKAGDELIIFTKDNIAFIDVFWACLFGGIVPVPVAVGISDEHRSKLFKIFQKLSNGYCIANDDDIERLANYAKTNGLSSSFNDLKAKTIAFEKIEINSNKGEIHQAHENDVAFIQFSSGSTSDPKGVVLTHKNIITNLNAIAQGAAYNENDISLSWMPLTHDMGLIGFHLNMIACNMSQCLIPTDLFSRRPLLWMQKTSSKKATVLCSPNFGYKHFLKALGDKTLDNINLSSVRLMYNGAEPISVDLCDEFLTKLSPYGLKRNTMFTVYGLAEATLAVAFPIHGQQYRTIYIDRHQCRMADKVVFIDKDHEDALSFAIEGKPVLDCQVKITDENNSTLAADTIGDVQIKGPNVTQGYYLNEQANMTALTGDGWVNTGDLGFLHDGELIIIGRTKDIIFAHGQNYYPHDLENIALQHKLIELGKIVCYGIRQDKEQRDELILFILYRKDIEGFAVLAREVAKIINEQTGLEADHVIPVKRIPKTTSGKVQRRILGDEYLNGEFDAIISQLDAINAASHVALNEDMTAREKELKEICQSVLKGIVLNINDNFFDAGISSLTLAEIHQKIDDKYPDVVDIIDLFEYQTIKELATFMNEKL
ncbi:Polyketide synthase modules and related proteins [hydrothermal vent metagenome]|uniref:Polyketide synthase modules and related proteins n=1 Tax=hydrothermal vent metagenome TaxID=652676 RepID=A0A3B1AM64_9ZZZZ